MRKIRLVYFLSMIYLLITACGGSKFLTKSDAFPQMYENQPISILVLPPINETTAADAKEYYSTTIAEPLTLSGYYIYPIEVTSDILRAEGIYDTELLASVPPQKFREFFGADAVLYIRLLKWDTAYYVVGGNVTVAVDFTLISTDTGEKLWGYDGQMVVDTGGGSNSGGGLAGLIAQVVVTAINTATTDYVPIAKQANYMTLTSIPYGKYHPEHNQDREAKVVLENKVKAQDKPEAK